MMDYPDELLQQVFPEMYAPKIKPDEDDQYSALTKTCITIIFIMILVAISWL